MTPPPPAPSRPRRKWAQLVLLLVLFFGPLLFAFMTYYGSSWRPVGHTNHGTLIEPARPLPAAAFLAGQHDLAPDLFTGKWSMAYISDGQCDAACRRTLYFMQQTQLSLGSLIPRTQRVWLTTGHCCAADADAATRPPLIVVDADSDAGRAWLTTFPTDRRPRTIFIVDPLGNLMMRYASDANPKGLREDLKKLMGLSQIG